MEATKKKVNVERAQNFMRQYRDPHSRELKKVTFNIEFKQFLVK